MKSRPWAHRKCSGNAVADALHPVSLAVWPLPSFQQRQWHLEKMFMASTTTAMLLGFAIWHAFCSRMRLLSVQSVNQWWSNKKPVRARLWRWRSGLKKDTLRTVLLPALGSVLAPFSFWLALLLNVSLSWLLFFHLKMSAVQITCSTGV